jgi:EAL domain-containing protein (putative c-di-GMP-specific phosphodiesterase class I)
LRKPVAIGNHALTVTASIGITIAPDDGNSAETLLKNADLALYRAKGRGRDTFQFFVDGMNKEIADRLFVQRELWTSLELGQFVQYFQPIWQLRDASPVCAEALTRWQHPVRGLLLTEEFIDLAEQSELIVRIGQWVIESACAHVARLRRAGCEHTRIALNISARQISGELIEAFERAIRQHAIDGRDLEVEIGETMLMTNLVETRVALERLKYFGVTIAIDDFGTGHYSLSYLKDLPIDILKIDHSFIQRIETSRKHAEIVAAVIAMAHKLRIKVVAEGIETQGPLRFLIANGCNLGQGYLLGKPSTFDTFVEMVCSTDRIDYAETIT